MTDEQRWEHDASLKVTCKDCSANCCKHIAVPIDEPSTPEDFAAIRWWVSHDDISVYKDVENDWVVEFRSKCGNLEGNRCTVYGGVKYPHICKEYEMRTCVMNEEGDYWLILFENPVDVDKYCAEHHIATVPYTTAADCVTVAIETPETADDFEDLWWYIAHRDVTVYRKNGEWFLHCNTTCKMSCERKHAHLPRDAEVIFKVWEDISLYCKEHGIGREETRSPLALTNL